MKGVQISYQLPSGGYMLKQFRPGNPKILDEVRRLRKRRTEATVTYGDLSGRIEVGAVWKFDGRWTWYLDCDVAGLREE